VWRRHRRVAVIASQKRSKAVRLTLAVPFEACVFQASPAVPPAASACDCTASLVMDGLRMRVRSGLPTNFYTEEREYVDLGSCEEERGI
jgi:hypothetical protein